MKVLITGAGLIGCRTATLLAARGDDVVLIDLRPDPAAIASMLPVGAATVVTGDLRDRTAVMEFVASGRFDAIVHSAAALSSAIRQQPTLAADVQVLSRTYPRV